MHARPKYFDPNIIETWQSRNCMEIRIRTFAPHVASSLFAVWSGTNSTGIRLLSLQINIYELGEPNFGGPTSTRVEIDSPTVRHFLAERNELQRGRIDTAKRSRSFRDYLSHC
jgi:hypothetical protein